MTQLAPDVHITRKRTTEARDRAEALPAKAKTLDQVLHVREIAKATEQYCRAASQSRQVAKEAAEIRLRAEQKAGQILVEMKRKRPGTGGDPGNRSLPGLADLGIEKMQSHRWQQIAAVPEPVFEAYIEKAKVR